MGPSGSRQSQGYSQHLPSDHEHFTLPRPSKDKLNFSRGHHHAKKYPTRKERAPACPKPTRKTLLLSSTPNFIPPRGQSQRWEPQTRFWHHLHPPPAHGVPSLPVSILLLLFQLCWPGAARWCCPFVSRRRMAVAAQGRSYLSCAGRKGDAGTHVSPVGLLALILLVPEMGFCSLAGSCQPAASRTPTCHFHVC